MQMFKDKPPLILACNKLVLKLKAYSHKVICNDCSNQFITQINHSWTYKPQGSSWVFKYTRVFCQMNFYPYIQKDLSS